MAAKILIVEDDTTLSQMYKFKFEAEGFVVVAAVNGKLGLEAAEKEKPDIILLDLMMPEMSGDEMLAKMRQTDWGKSIKVVVLTNLSENEIPDTVLQNQVAAVVLKANMTPKQVTEIIKTQLAKNGEAPAAA